MDKLKAQLAPVLQHSFWIMASGILIWTLASWWMSTGSLNAQKTARLTEIKTSFEAMDGLRSKQPKHPNASTSAGMDGLIKEYADLVGKGWDLQYKKQIDVLVWPQKFTFRARVEKMRPIEIVPPPANPPAKMPDGIEDLLRQDREEYRNYVENELPNLAKKIGRAWKVTTQMNDTSGAGGFAPPSSDAIAPGGTQMLDPNTGQPILALDTSVVLWDSANQQEILQTHFGLALKNQLPSTAEILYAQEDFWVLDNIMNIISATNDKATGRHEAVVKNIYFVRIGRSARGQAGKVQSVTQALASEAAVGGVASGSAEATAPTAGAEGSAMPGPAADGSTPLAIVDPAEGRYVDDKYEALTAAKLRGALTSTNPEDALLAVAKRMPVRLRLRVDQRKLHILLAACGNSKLPLEVRQVRLNREPAPLNNDMGGGGSYAAAPSFGGGEGSGFGGSGFGGSGFGAMPGAEGSGSFGGSGFGGGGSGMPGGQRAGSLTGDAWIDPNQIDVELYGIVYIYNPVNYKQLGIEEQAVPPPGAGAPAPTPAPTTTTSAPAPASPALTAAAS